MDQIGSFKFNKDECQCLSQTLSDITESSYYNTSPTNLRITLNSLEIFVKNVCLIPPDCLCVLPGD